VRDAAVELKVPSRRDGGTGLTCGARRVICSRVVVTRVRCRLFVLHC
jgi:hypothetical protein